MERLNPELNGSAGRMTLDFLRQAWRWFRRRRQLRREMRYLAQMSEHQLRDIGLTPSERSEALRRFG